MQTLTESSLALLPTDLAAAHALLLCERAARIEAEADLARAKAVNSSDEALIANLKLEIEKLRRQLYGHRSERKSRLLDQLELRLEELEAAASEDEQASATASQSTAVAPHRRKRPARKPFPEHLPRERVVIAAPASCPCCGSGKLSKLGEDITETLEVIPRQWPAPMEGDPDGAGEVQLPGLREDHAATGAVPCDTPGFCRSEPAGDDPVREVRPASALEPAVQSLPARGHRLERLDPG